ncbi:hypothetical protein FRC12_021707 [Ceratobasidium sp. 428]|nr:hypothetical protein FRC12_021707 [Ceratobasidium sp. 428]
MPAEQDNRRRRRRRSKSPVPPLCPGQGPVDVHDLDTERSPLPTDARQLTRMVAMSWNPRTLVNVAYQLCQAAEANSEQVFRDSASKTVKMYLELFDKLNELQPKLWELLIMRSDGHFTRNIRQKLCDGRDGARAEDNGKVKNALPHIFKWEPSLVNQPKSNRGLAHPQCAYYLSSIETNWEDLEERRQFIECANPLMTAEHWPRVLYVEGKGDVDNPSQGLLKNPLLVNIAKANLKSPSSVIPTASVRPNAVRRGRKGIAAKYQLTKITTAFLAYVAVLTRFALSAEDTFSEDGGTFNYVAFYNELREFLEAAHFQSRAKVLIAWWNKALFPNHIEENSGTGSTNNG